MFLTAEEKKWLEVMTTTGTLLPVVVLHAFFEDSLSRWEKFQGYRPSTWPPVLGWIKIAGEFKTPSDAAAIIDLCPVERRREVAIAYLAWNRHDSTSKTLNPYEPLLSFFHYGGTWSRPENGILDIYDGIGGRCEILLKSAF